MGEACARDVGTPAERLSLLATEARDAQTSPSPSTRRNPNVSTDARRLRSDGRRRAPARLERAGPGGAGYQKRALPVIAWLGELALRQKPPHSRPPCEGRLLGHRDQAGAGTGAGRLPVFTRKAATDTSYLACARALLGRRDGIFPQFATHNAHTLVGGSGIRGEQSGFRISAPAWHGRGALRTVSRGEAPGPHGSRAPGSMRRSARTKICSPIWCGGCSKTARTRRS